MANTWSLSGNRHAHATLEGGQTNSVAFVRSGHRGGLSFFLPLFLFSDVLSGGGGGVASSSSSARFGFAVAVASQNTFIRPICAELSSRMCAPALHAAPLPSFPSLPLALAAGP